MFRAFAPPHEVIVTEYVSSWTEPSQMAHAE
jgi:hypothetical protein